MLPSNQIYLTSFCATLTNNTSNLITWPNIDILKFGQIRQTIEEQIKSLTDELYSMLHINILRNTYINISGQPGGARGAAVPQY